MRLPAQPNFITLACRDVERMAELLRAFGWPESPESEPVQPAVPGQERRRDRALRRVQLRAAFRRRPGRVPRLHARRQPRRAGEVDTAYAELQAIEGVELLGEPVDSVHGFRGFSFRDPEGNVWDVAWKRGSRVQPDGSLTWGGG